jgi:Pyruvate/2-oxoacid:ferredoxin oxidoreductase delta subunit
MVRDDKDPWEALRVRMSRWPVRTPKTKSIQQLLRLLYTAEEARLLHAFTQPYTDAKTAEEIAAATKHAVDSTRRQLDDLAQRGLLMKTHSRTGLVRYHLMPLLPGLFEAYFAGEIPAENREEARKLMKGAYDEGLGMELGPSDYPWSRVLPIEKTISVNRQVEAAPAILPFEKVSEFIRSSWRIALIRCACRVKTPCTHPVETCLCFDNMAAYMIERGAGKEVTVEQALTLLDQFEKAGLMHTTTNAQTKPQFICNCCACSCNLLGGLVRLHNPRAFAKSNFVIQRDDAACTTCGKCVEICPFGANQRHGAHDKEPARIITFAERCVGCGLCAYHCPKKAIRLVKIRDETPEPTPVEAWQKVEAQRVH